MQYSSSKKWFVAILLGFLSVWISPVLGQDCVTPDGLSPWLGIFPQEDFIYSFDSTSSFGYAKVGSHLEVWDVSNPAAPVELNILVEHPGGINKFEVFDNLLVLETGSPNGMGLLPIDSSGVPTLAAWIPCNYPVRSFKVYQNVLYFSVDDMGILIYDISEIENPVFHGVLTTSGPTTFLNEPINGLLYVGSSPEGGNSLDVYDLSSPLEPVFVSRCQGEQPSQFLVVGNIGYGLTWMGYVVSYDLSEPSHPVFLDSVHATSPGYGYDLLFDHGKLLVKSYYYIRQINIENPSSLISELFLTDFPLGYYVYQVGDTYYFNCSDGSFWIRKRNTPLDSVVATIPLDYDVRNSALQGDWLFVGGEALTVIDVSRPERPLVVSQLPLPLNTYSIALKGDAAYLAAGQHGFYIIDISNPFSCQIAGTRSAPPGSFTTLTKIAVGGNILVAIGNSVMYSVFDISNPLNPGASFSYTGTSHTSYSVAAVENCFFVENSSGSIYNSISVYSVPDFNGYPTFLRRIYGVSPKIQGVVGDFLISGVDSLGLTSVALPHMPSVLGTFPVPAGNPTFDGQFLYAQDATDEYHVVDFSDPLAPADLGILAIPNDVEDLIYCNGNLVARLDDGVIIVPAMCPPASGVEEETWPQTAPLESVLNLRVGPNPFNPRTVVSITLTQTSEVEVNIFDLAGRKIATIAQEEFYPGTHELVWNGISSTGKQVPSGTYLIRAKTGNSVNSLKVSLIR